MTNSTGNKRADAVIAVEEVPSEELHLYGIVKLMEDESLKVRGRPAADIVEKPLPENAPGRMAVAARVRFFHPSFSMPWLIQNRGKSSEIAAYGRRQIDDPMGKESLCLGPLLPVRKDMTSEVSKAISRAFIDFSLSDKQFGSSFGLGRIDKVEDHLGVKT